MGRWAYLDSDEERLPEGMRRVAYDADTQTYTYEDAEGEMWEGVPGAKYGRLHRVSRDSHRAPPLPVFESDDKDIDGDEPEYVLHDPDDDIGTKDNNETTFDSILSKESLTTEPNDSHTTEPKKAYMKRWNSLSRAATKFIPKLPPLPGDSRAAPPEGDGHSQRSSGETLKVSTSLPRRRASTISTITRGVADGVKQMFAEQSEYRAHRAR